MIVLQAHHFAQLQGAAATQNLIGMAHAWAVGSTAAALLLCDAREWNTKIKVKDFGSCTMICFVILG